MCIRDSTDTAQFTSLLLRLCKRTDVLYRQLSSATVTSAERYRAKLQALTLLFVESTDVRPEVHYDAEAEGSSVQPGTVTGSARRSSTASHVSRVRCAVVSGSGAPVADRQADPTTLLRDQLRRPCRFQPCETACSRGPASRPIRPSDPPPPRVPKSSSLLRCSARSASLLIGDIYCFMCSLLCRTLLLVTLR